MLKLHFYNHKILRHLKKQSFYHCCKCCLCKAYSPDTFQTHLVYRYILIIKKHFIKLQGEQKVLGPFLVLRLDIFNITFYCFECAKYFAKLSI